METCDIAVIGGGAAGLTAAIFAAGGADRRRARGKGGILVLDGATSIGAKILVSGGGRCNVTHREVTPRDFNGSQRVIRNVLAAFDVKATRLWFASLGVRLECEAGGKLFPVSHNARTVVTALLQRCQTMGVEVRPGHRIRAVQHSHDDERRAPRFLLRYDRGQIAAARLIFATGGRSLPRTGSDGGGWDILRGLGHRVTATHPALVPLVLRRPMFHAELSGLSVEVELSVFADGKRIDRRRGSMLWTHFGVSGPVVLDASRHWVAACSDGHRVELRCNFLLDLDFARTDDWLVDAAHARPRLSVGHCLATRLPERLAACLVRAASCDPSTPLGQMTRPQRQAIVHTLTGFRLPVERDRGWDFAEVTAGGVPLSEIDYRTMESRLVPGLYLVGELLDCDGRIGGFNFQWAWSSGKVAGSAAAAALSRTCASSPP